MPVLSNPKWERFAQELAKGKSAFEAYQTAGYKPDTGAASRLSGKVSIRERVTEILDRGALRAEVTVQTILDELAEARNLALQNGQPAAAVAASMGRAKVRGLIIDRKETGRPGDFEAMSDNELDAFIAERADLIGESTSREGTERISSAVRKFVN